MIASIKGLISHKSASELVVDVNGIGYRVTVPLSTFYVLPEPGEPVFLNVYTHVREDAFQLFGFCTVEEKSLFQLMISVTGIGPRLAVNILSGMPAPDLLDAIAAGNLTRLTSIPGIGKKMAERLVFELKAKAADLIARAPESAREATPSRDAVPDDALSALVNLGYKNNAAKQAVEKIMKDYPEGMSLEELLKRSLKILGA